MSATKPFIEPGTYYPAYKISGWMGDYRACVVDYEPGYVPVDGYWIPADWRELVKLNPSFTVPESWWRLKRVMERNEP